MAVGVVRTSTGANGVPDRYVVQERLNSRMDLIDLIRAGDVRALAKAISKLEDGSPEGLEILRALFPYGGGARVVGLTGAPGVGKSTMINHMAREYIERGLKVAVLAVDPSSPFTGGAVLGDRVRMQQAHPNLFIRSMASHCHLGGLTRTIGAVISLLDAAGYQRIILETVGAGQGEIEVRDYAHTVIVLIVPHMGDDIQAMKAGIMEIGDIYVVNKADLPGAARAMEELRAMLATRALWRRNLAGSGSFCGCSRWKRD